MGSHICTANIVYKAVCNNNIVYNRKKLRISGNLPCQFKRNWHGIWMVASLVIHRIFYERQYVPPSSLNPQLKPRSEIRALVKDSWNEVQYISLGSLEINNEKLEQYYRLPQNNPSSTEKQLSCFLKHLLFLAEHIILNSMLFGISSPDVSLYARGMYETKSGYYFSCCKHFTIFRKAKRYTLR